jgi:hypothetical protein
MPAGASWFSEHGPVEPLMNAIPVAVVSYCAVISAASSRKSEYHV